MSDAPRLELFEAFGIELEYMVVDSTTLDVRPVVDELIKLQTGRYDCDFENGPITWSNELVAHVVELKVSQPTAELAALPAQFTENVARINQSLGELNARLLPSAMHPWMDPNREMRLWPHEYAEVYQRFDRVFDCRGHGWANLQSVHLNLPFADDEQFGRLHAAVRLVLPILPALAASSPILERKSTGWLDTRLDVYRGNARRIPSVCGRVIPEPIYTRDQYYEQVFRPMWADLAPHDPAGVLQEEFLNARGAIARFDRGAIEIRLLDVQECPLADVAICALVIEVLRWLVEAQFAPLAEQRAWPVEPLAELLWNVARDGPAAPIHDRAYLAQWGCRANDPSQGPWTAGRLWQVLLERACESSPGFAEAWEHPIRTILQQGTLAQRILAAVGGDFSREHLAAVYVRLADCLSSGQQFLPGG